MKTRMQLRCAALPLAICASTLLLAGNARAADQFNVPPGAGVINVQNYGAVPNDGVDDTNAIKAAIAYVFQNASRYGAPMIIYFPNGTYNVSDTIAYRVGQYPTAWGDGWLSGAHFIGQSRSGVIIRLQDNCPGFEGTSDIKPVFKTGSEEQQGIEGQPNPDGWGNEAFLHTFRNMTIDTGRGNPGAVGIDYLVSNRGNISDVTIRSGDGLAWAGIYMTRAWPGPGLIKNVQVDGFQVGIDMGGNVGGEYGGHFQYGMTFENITLNNQKLVGMQTVSNVMAIRKLTVNGSVPALWQFNWPSHITLIDATINRTGSINQADAAIRINGTALIRNLRSTGSNLVIDRVTASGNPDVTGGSGTTVVSEWTTYAPVSQFTPNSGRTLNLPVEETPEYTNSNYSTEWANVVSYGATPNDSSNDDAPAIQAALNSGRPVVYLPNGEYRINSTLTIPSSVRKIIGFTAAIIPKTTLNPVLRYNGTNTCVIEQINVFDDFGSFGIEHNSTGTLVFRNGTFSTGYRTTQAGKTFTEDTMGRPITISSGHRFWARQLNTEFGSGAHVVNNGGTVWILNQKTEGAQTNIKSTGGAVELLGGFYYPLSNVDASIPAVDLTDTRASLSYVVNNENYAVHVREKRGNITRNSPNYGRTVNLYVSGGTTRTTSSYSFSDISSDGFALNGLRGDIDWGTGQWGADGITSWAGLTKYGYFWTSSNSRSFTLPVGASLNSIKISSDRAGTYTISDGVNPNRTGSYSANSPVTVNTGWTSGGNNITVTFSTGWFSGIDDIVYNQ